MLPLTRIIDSASPTGRKTVAPTVGALLLGVLMDRTDPHYVLGTSYASAGLFIALIGSATGSPWLLAFAVHRRRRRARLQRLLS
jgi:MFS transporter, AAHS family, 4-hydroxybenzoate transporter